MNSSRVATLILLFWSAATIEAATISQAQNDFFENKIRPVLAEHCYQCHNSIDKSKGDIALDYRDAVLASDVLVPGAPEKSRLVRAIRHVEGFEPMPSKAPKLANIIIKNLEDWIRMGAPDPRLEKPTKEQLAVEVDWETVREKRKEWWSFQPIEMPIPPKVSDTGWDQNPIDRFIFARLTENQLQAQPVASPEILVRRLHLILTGLPPEPRTVEAFVRNPTPEAYQRFVDELMASPHYGERWARYWMDWYRYAESHGSEGDPGIPHAPQYRDYLIRAINADVPYDQLIREHLAGDLLSDPRINQALGLNESAIGPAHFRLAPHGFGVTDAYDEQITFTDNQIDVMSKAMLGLTVSCARCHNHKFDPISQRDFYKFYGIMISSRPGMVNVDSPERQNLHKQELTGLKIKIRKEMGALWLDQVDQAIDRLVSFKFEDEPKKPGKDESSKTYDLNVEINRHSNAHPFAAWKLLNNVPEENWGARIEEMIAQHRDALSHNERVRNTATFYADLRDQNTYDTWFKSGNGLGPTISPAGSFAVAGQGLDVVTGIYPAGAYTHLLSDKHSGILGSIFHRARGRRTEIRANGFNATARFSVRSYPLTHGGLHPAPVLNPVMSWVKINKYFYWNGDKGYYRLETALDKTAGFRGTGRERSWFGLAEVYGGDESMKLIGAPLAALPGELTEVRDRDSLRDYYRTALEQSLNAWRDARITDEQAQFLDAFVRHGFLPNAFESLPPAAKETVSNYRRLENEIPIPQRAPGVVEGEPWDQPLLTRGDYRKEETPVTRGFLEAFSGKAYDQTSSGRLELADDMLRDENTLTARVLVNRLWHHTFGRGLVASVDNFGRLGNLPTHPLLLDYLAADFRKNQWSMKRLIRQMVLSRTFRSASTAPASTIEKDPENLFLSYYTPRRLDAEAILDSIQFVSDRLDHGRPDLAGIGSPGHRAVYRRVRRNFLDPFLTVFNYPIPTSTVGARNSTDVPAQSLMLMNGSIVRSAAKEWSHQVVRNQGLKTDEARINQLFLQAYSRPPTPEEMQACRAFLENEAERENGYFRIAHAILNSKELIYVH